VAARRRIEEAGAGRKAQNTAAMWRERSTTVRRGMASGPIGAWFEGKPGTQPGSAAKRFGDNFFEIVHPIDGCAVCPAVQADSLAGFAKGVRRLLPEPQNTAIITFLDINKSSFVSRSLKLLKAVHSDLSMCLSGAVVVSGVTGSVTACSNGNGSKAN
jgi:hypothetical protein